MRPNTSATASLLVAIGSLAAVITVDAQASTEYLEHCQLCPLAGCPPEHHDSACDKPRQNALWAAEAAAEAARPEDAIPDAVYLRLPEEQTWTCPLDTTGEDSGDYAGGYGRVTRWIVRNEASTPVVLSHVNALGLEVSAADFRTYPAHADTAVYPHGPILPPGQVAVVEGRQGQLFVAREYREVLPMEAFGLTAAEDEAFGHSWESFKRALPPTLSFLPEQASYRTGKGVWHVLGKPGRVLLKHRLGNIHVKNQFGALCPEATGASVAADAPAPRASLPNDMNPGCNVLVKAFLNTVGCPVEVFFAPPNRGAAGYDCERFQAHLGTLAAYAAPDAGRARHLDDPASPLKFPNTYNGHTFVARMAHDGALVARISVDGDIVRDCPAPAREGAGGAARAREPLLRGVPGVLTAANATVPVRAADQWRVVVLANGTSASVFSGKVHQEKYDIGWQNTTGVMLTSVPIVS